MKARSARRWPCGNCKSLLREYSDKVVGTRLEAKGLSHDTLKPFKTDVENVAPPEKVTGSVLGGLIPYMIIFLCFVGAVTPAIDLTAGEKERGTMETILVTPISRSDLVRRASSCSSSPSHSSPRCCR